MQQQRNGNDGNGDGRCDGCSNGNAAERSQVAVVNGIEDNNTGALGMENETSGGNYGEV